jgi:hypothetical protein
MRLEELDKLKKKGVTASEIEPVTFLLYNIVPQPTAVRRACIYILTEYLVSYPVS